MTDFVSACSSWRPSRCGSARRRRVPAVNDRKGPRCNGSSAGCAGCRRESRNRRRFAGEGALAQQYSLDAPMRCRFRSRFARPSARYNRIDDHGRRFPGPMRWRSRSFSCCSCAQPVFSGDLAPSQHSTPALRAAQATKRCISRRAASRALTCSRALRAGHAFPAAMQMVATEARTPLPPVPDHLRESTTRVRERRMLKPGHARAEHRPALLRHRVLLQRETGATSRVARQPRVADPRAFKLLGKIRVLSAEGNFRRTSCSGFPSYRGRDPAREPRIHEGAVDRSGRIEACVRRAADDGVRRVLDVAHREDPRIGASPWTRTGSCSSS